MNTPEAPNSRTATPTITLNTPLANSHAAGALVEAIVSPDGAILGNGNFLAQSFLAANQFGTTTNSVSDDGTKLFFESPPSFAGGSGSAEGVGPSHLFMRDTSNGGSTTLIDNPVAPTGQAIYEGASQDGSKVFFTSDEGLGGNPNADNEVYEFNTVTKTVTKTVAASSAPSVFRSLTWMPTSRCPFFVVSFRDKSSSFTWKEIVELTGR